MWHVDLAVKSKSNADPSPGLTCIEWGLWLGVRATLRIHFPVPRYSWRCQHHQLFRSHQHHCPRVPALSSLNLAWRRYGACTLAI